LKTSRYRKGAQSALLFTIVVISIVSASFGSQFPGAIIRTRTTGLINYWPHVDVAINANQVIGVNNLSLGFMLDWHRWVPFIDRPAQRQLAYDANFKLVRVFDFRKISPYGYSDLMPCTHWNESTKTGTWDWTQVDSLVDAIFDVGAEPLFCLGWARDNIKNYIPRGMAVDPDTGLPYPQSYAAYAREWVRHFESLDLPVRFYQISNEPYHYFGWSQSPELGHYVEFWNTVARAMRGENPNILLSHDATTIRMVLDYWIEHGDDLDFFDFHKYDAATIGGYSDAQMFNLAELRYFENYGNYYGVEEARQKWFDARGKWLPVICSESNFNYAWETGTDPKMQQMAGSVWIALVLRMGMLKGLACNVYFEFSSSKSGQEARGAGWGFGMINEDDNQPWYPYYVHKMVGSNLAVGDEIVEAESSSNEIRSVAWFHDGKLNILLICKSDEPKTVRLHGISEELNASWIDDTIPYESPSIQTDKISLDEPLIMKGYTVALLQIYAANQ